MKLTIEFDIDNAAFDDDEGRPEIARILKKLAKELIEGLLPSEGILIHDLNGQKVGSLYVSGTPAEEIQKNREIIGYVLIDAEGVDASDIFKDHTDAQREADAWNDDDAETMADEAEIKIDLYKQGTDWKVYQVRAIDKAGDLHLPDDTIQLGDRLFAYKEGIN